MLHHSSPGSSCGSCAVTRFPCDGEECSWHELLVSQHDGVSSPSSDRLKTRLRVFVGAEGLGGGLSMNELPRLLMVAISVACSVRTRGRCGGGKVSVTCNAGGYVI